MIVRSRVVTSVVASTTALATLAVGEPISPNPFPITGCFVQTRESCCNFAGLERHVITCSGVATPCPAVIDGTASGSVWYIRPAVGAGYTPVHFTVQPASSVCVWYPPACDMTGPTPGCGHAPVAMTFHCDDQVFLFPPSEGTDCSGGAVE